VAVPVTVFELQLSVVQHIEHVIIDGLDMSHTYVVQFAAHP
jgi:hypothetical protein